MDNNRTISLPGAGELLSKSFQIYKSRIGVFVGIMVIPFLASLLFSGLVFLSKTLKIPWVWFIVAIIGLFVLIIMNLWSGVSLLYAIKEREEKIGIKESFRKGWHKIFSYWWISILLGLITVAGFLLFIVPGIVFTIWFSLALYILVSEDVKGMNALFRSKQLIKGYWWGVFGRILLMGLIVGVLLLLIRFVLSFTGLSTFVAKNTIDTFVDLLKNLLMIPFSATFGFLIYENLKYIKKDELFTISERKTKIGLILIALFVFLLIPLLVLALILTIRFIGFSPNIETFIIKIKDLMLILRS